MPNSSGSSYQTMWCPSLLQQSPTWSVLDPTYLYDGWQHELLPLMFPPDLSLLAIGFEPTEPAARETKFEEVISLSRRASPCPVDLNEFAPGATQFEAGHMDGLDWAGTRVASTQSSPRGGAVFTDGNESDDQMDCAIPTTQEDVSDEKWQEVQRPSAAPSTRSRRRKRDQSVSTSDRADQARKPLSGTPAPSMAPDRLRKARVTSHNHTEKKYRNRINQQFQLLAETLCLERNGPSPEDEARGPSKADLLSVATRRIRSQQKELDSQVEQIDTFKRAIQSLRTRGLCSAAPVAPWETVL